MNTPPDLPRVERVDWFLQVFVELANEEPFEMPVTLASGGLVVSGQLVSGRRYFEGFAEEFAAAISDATEDVKTYWRDFLADFGTSVYGGRGEDLSDAADESESNGEDDDVSDPHYIHLRDARFFHQGTGHAPLVAGVWWRARIEAVDGFFLGRLGVTPGESQRVSEIG